MLNVPVRCIPDLPNALQVGIPGRCSWRAVRLSRHIRRQKKGGHKGSRLHPKTFHAFAKTIPKPFTLGLMPSMRTPFINPCGVDETTGTLTWFSRGTIRSSVFNAPQETTSASAFFDLA